MLRDVSMEEISDGKLYGLNDMVKAGCDDCKGCSSCCRGMGSSIVLDPYDMYRLTEGLGKPAAQLLGESLELSVVDGIVQPNIRMAGETEQCLFLNEEGRCTIHSFRPGICRLFPLGRYYNGEGGFQYFLQVHECRKENRTKVKVRKWIDTPDAVQYEKFVADWHYFLKDLQEKLSDENGNAVSMYILKQFYLSPYGNGDFYEEFYARLEQAVNWKNTL